MQKYKTLHMKKQSTKSIDTMKAVFVKSSSDVSQCPNPNKPEFAFIGRSNVGKSSLVNMLVSQKGLAKVSATPGKTIHINHYLVNDKWYLVDLPGYGYAKRSKDMRNEWQQTMDNYFDQRENLACVCILVDSRLTPQAIDLEFIEYIGQKGIPFIIIFTKADKGTQVSTVKNVAEFKKSLLDEWEELPEMFITSAEKKTGRIELLSFLDQVSDEFNSAIQS
jgi:GTP-binding protein